MQHERVFSTVNQDEIQHVERAYRPDARHERRLAVPVEGLQREAACEALAALGHERANALIDRQVAGKGLRSELWKAALHAEEDARSIKEDRGIEALAHEADGLE